MKKFLGLIVAFVFMVSSLTMFGGRAQAQTLDEADKYFLEFVSSDTNLDGDITFSHRPLYNIDLEQNGREYVFSIGDTYGYALMVQFEGEQKVFYEIEELHYSKTSPFANCEGLPVYITNNAYIEYKDQGFYDVISGSQLSQEILQDCVNNGFNYFGGTTAAFENTRITIDYARKTVEEYSMQYDLPSMPGSVEGGSCAHNAGAVVISYYDRFCENLIPNYDPMLVIGPIVKYRGNSAEAIQLTEELVDLMVIGEPHEGVTFSEFQLGMETYVEQQGYTYSTTNIFSNGSFNFNNYKNAVENYRPVALFLINFTMSGGISEGDGQDILGLAYCPVSHVAVGCGYKIITYYDANDNIITTRNYLKVSCNLINYGISYLSVSESNINKAISILVS